MAGYSDTDSRRGETNSWVAKIAFCDGLEERRLSDVCKTNLSQREKTRMRQKVKPLVFDRVFFDAYYTTLQVVTGPAQQNLLFLNGLFWCHCSSLAVVAAGRDWEDARGAIKHRFR